MKIKLKFFNPISVSFSMMTFLFKFQWENKFWIFILCGIKIDWRRKLIVLNVIEAHQIKSFCIYSCSAHVFDFVFSSYFKVQWKILVENVWKKEARKFNFRDFFTFFFSFFIYFMEGKNSLTSHPFTKFFITFF